MNKILRRSFTTCSIGNDVLVIGSGGMACLVGTALSSFGKSVTLCTRWTDQIQNIRQKNGLVRTNPDGTESFFSVEASESVEGEFSSCFVGVKSYDTSRAMDLIRKTIKPGGVVFSMQNGLEAAEKLKDLENEGFKLVLGCTTAGANVVTPGTVYWNGEGVTQLGGNAQASEELKNILNEAGLPSETTNNLEKTMWTKVGVNAVVNSLATLQNKPNGVLLEDRFAPSIRHILEEVVEAASKKGVEVDLEELIKRTEDTISNTRDNVNSMLIDFRRNAPTEVSAINGYISRTSEKAKLNRLLTTLIEEGSPNNNTLQISGVKEICLHRNTIREKVIFVPFLGGLHDAHLALVDKAKSLGGQVWCSLFLNKLQFNVESDYDTYPYTMQEDLQKLRDRGVDVVWTPQLNDMYPVDPENDFPPRVVFPGIADKTKEGLVRPGHFDGVATVVTKLFSMVRPDVAIFGEKDFVQSVLVQKIRDEYFPTLDIIVHPTVRETDGLAMSTRNLRLSEDERQKAPCIYQTLCEVRDKIQEGERSVKTLVQHGETFAASRGVDLEYLSLTNGKTAQEIEDEIPQGVKINISIAGSVGPSTRLIDNIMI